MGTQTVNGAEKLGAKTWRPQLTYFAEGVVVAVVVVAVVVVAVVVVAVVVVAG